MNLYIGVMSGTSLDGIDIALVDFTSSAKLIHKAEYPYPLELKNQLLPLSQGKKVSLEEIGTIDHLLGKCYAQCINQFLQEFNLNKQDICAIGCHGQTVFHQPNSKTPFTMQLGDPNIISALTAITTVADFRRKDMAFGGQGAPLVPAFHQAIFAKTNETCVVLNIGGIANISVLDPNSSVIGFDTGPGNMLMDAWIEKNLNHSFDINGQWAATGKVNQELLTHFLNDSYFSLPIPKSTGREHFHIGWLEQHLSKFETINPEDVQATLLALTVQSIANEVKKYPQGELLVCGGGAKNQQLLIGLKHSLIDWQVMTTNDKGVDADSLEAMAFAWLAFRTMNKQSGNLSSVTGASQSCILGAIYLAN